jgi:hypothetical protein
MIPKKPAPDQRREWPVLRPRELLELRPQLPLEAHMQRCIWRFAFHRAIERHRAERKTHSVDARLSNQLAFNCDGHHKMSDLGAPSEPLHSATRCPAPVCPRGRRGADCGEKIMTLMRKTTNRTSNFGHATFEARTLDDAELNTVTGGSISLSYEQIKFEYTEQGPASPAPPAKHWFNGG